MSDFRGEVGGRLNIAFTLNFHDAAGNVIDVRVRRPPAAPEVGPWVVAMIRKAGPFPPPAKLGKAVYTDIWLVHKGGNFQLDTLTEGQN